MEDEGFAKDDFGLTGVFAEVEVNGIVHAVFLVPAVLADVVAEGFSVLSVGFGIAGHRKSFSEIGHGEEFAIHEAVEEDVGGTAFGTEEGGGIVVNADGEIVLPVEESGCGMAVMLLIVEDEGLHAAESFLEPRGIAAVLTGDEGGMLGDDGLVHVGGVDIAGLDEIGVAIGSYDHGHVAVVGGGIGEVVEHAALLIDECFAAVFPGADVGECLTEGDIGEPGVPVPQHVGVLSAAGCEIGVDEGAARGLAEHLFIVGIDVLADELPQGLTVLCACG